MSQAEEEEEEKEEESRKKEEEEKKKRQEKGGCMVPQKLDVAEEIQTLWHQWRGQAACMVQIPALPLTNYMT